MSGHPRHASTPPRGARGRSVALVFLVACCLTAFGLFRLGAIGLPSGGVGASTGEGATTPDAAASVVEQTVPASTQGAQAPQSTTDVSLMMVGDVLVHRRVWESGQRPDGSLNYDHLFANISSDAASADIAMLNQETILGGTKLGLSGYPSFNSPQEIGDAEAAAGFDVVTAATNHALDMGVEGIRSELEFWRGSHPNVACLGIAESQEDYDNIHVSEKDGLRVAILDYAQDTNGIPLPQDAPYAVHLLDADQVAADVTRARGMADIVVVCPHWGTEYSLEVTQMQEDWAQTFLDLGVDVVIGTHPHVLEPVEVKTGANGHQMVVFWSLGNFVSTQSQAMCMVGGEARVTFEKSGGSARVKSWELDPTVTQRATGTAMTAYRLADYTQELASSNAILGDDASFSTQYCMDLCSQVLGPGFDRSSCSISGTL